MKRKLTRDEVAVSEMSLRRIERDNLRLKEEIEEIELGIKLEEFKLREKYYEIAQRAKMRNLKEELEKTKEIRNQRIEQIAMNNQTAEIVKDQIQNGVVKKEV